MRSTLSWERVINLPLEVERSGGSVYEVAEKSSTLVYGFHGSGKTSLLLRLATEPTRLQEKKRGSDEFPRSVLVVNFKTTEARFHRVLTSEKDLHARWQKLRVGKVRWFSPGETITGDEVAWKIWQYIQEIKRSGLPIDRIVVDEIENAAVALPYVARESLFWTTLLQLFGTEAITSFLGFSLENEDINTDILNILRSEADYVFKIEPPAGGAPEKARGKGEAERVRVINEKRPDEMRNRESGLGVTSSGEDIEFEDENGEDEENAVD